MNHLVSRVAAAGAAAAVLTGGAAAAAPTATAAPATTAVAAARNPLTPTTSGQPGTCNHKSYMKDNSGRVMRDSRGVRIVLANHGGGNKLTSVQTVKAIRAAGFTWSQTRTAVMVVIGESGSCPKARRHNRDWGNGRLKSTDFGLFQINSYHHAWALRHNLDDPYANARVAYRISNKGRNWSAWHAWPEARQFSGQADRMIAEARRAGVR